MDYLEMIGALVGLIYLWLEYKASIYLWIVSIIMPAIYINVYYRAGLYADFGINIYFLLASLYGWIVWKWGKKKQKETSDKDSETSGIRHFDRSALPAVAGVFLVLFLLIGWILIQFTDSTVPWLDSFTTAASIIAMWMLTQNRSSNGWSGSSSTWSAAGSIFTKDSISRQRFMRSTPLSPCWAIGNG